ncbi:MAG: M48 family metallopeptidase [Phycisphaerales bacterium]|nr:M48 family metallopeptidase [Phycisphaerales bacterium]
MLPLIPILLVMTVLAANADVLITFGSGDTLSKGVVAVLAVVPTGLVVGLVAYCMALVDRSLGQGRTAMLRVGHRMRTAAQWVILLNYVFSVLVLDWLGVVQSAIGHVPLLSELVVMVPPILAFVILWWSWYPIERRLHETALLHRLDQGLPIHLPPDRWPYVCTQLRVHILLMLVPMLLILAASDAIETMFSHMDGEPSFRSTLAAICTAGAAGMVFLIAPWMARLLLGLCPMPRGEVRQDLEAVCHRHGVRVRDIMLWQTSGTMVNAAVMGMLPRLRYVLLTDALLEQLPRQHVLAVMAHEVGHVRCRHMPTLLLSLIATVIIAEAALYGMGALAPDWFASQDAASELARLAIALVIILLGFGWASRRIERQADAFAVRDLSGQDPACTVVTDEAIGAMTGSLEGIAALHGVDPRRWSWRHGAIAWRCGYLRSLSGCPLAGLPIDRTIRWLQCGAGGVLLLGGIIALSTLT